MIILEFTLETDHLDVIFVEEDLQQVLVGIGTYVLIKNISNDESYNVFWLNSNLTNSILIFCRSKTKRLFFKFLKKIKMYKY